MTEKGQSGDADFKDMYDVSELRATALSAGEHVLVRMIL